MVRKIDQLKTKKRLDSEFIELDNNIVYKTVKFCSIKSLASVLSSNFVHRLRYSIHEQNISKDNHVRARSADQSRQAQDWRRMGLPRALRSRARGRARAKEVCFNSYIMYYLFIYYVKEGGINGRFICSL
jgi:hypothetical protein